MSPFVLWLMGPTSGGKTTLAKYFVAKWQDEEIPVIHYDGDEIRNFFGPNHGFEPQDRMRVIDTIMHLTKKSAHAGFNVVVSALTANTDMRQRISNELDNIVIGYVSCPIKICAERDPKGLYSKAKSGEIETLIGWNIPYDPPKNPDIILRTDCYEPDALFDITDKHLKGR